MRVEAQITECSSQLLERDLRVGDERRRKVLGGVIGMQVDRHELAPLAAENRPRAGGEVLEPRAHSDDQVRLCCQFVAAARSGHARRAEVQRVARDDAALAGLGFQHRNVVRLGEGPKRLVGPGIKHATARHDHRALGLGDHPGDVGHLARIGFRPPNSPCARREEVLWVVEFLGLHVLAEGEHGRAAILRIGHHRHRARQRGQKMFGPRDAIEIGHGRAEAVIRRDRAVIEILDLLQHRVGAPVGEDIAADHEDRQSVHMR